ncbi:MAG: hypothetical protein V6Z82_04740 [Flavobacteriales bacterium]
MKKGKNIQDFGGLLSAHVQAHIKVQTHWCRVKEVTWDDKTFTCIGVADDLPFYNVSLGLGSFYRRPEKNSLCLIGVIENADTDAFLIDAEAFDKAVWQSGESELTIKKDGFVVKQGGESLKQVLNDWQTALYKLCEEVSKIVVSIGVTPNVAAIAEIKQQVQAIKERLNGILIA